MLQYKTQQNDTFELIAYKVYGSSKYMGFLMQNNLPLLDIFIFNSGVLINTPVLPTNVSENVPAWRQ